MAAGLKYAGSRVGRRVRMLVSGAALALIATQASASIYDVTIQDFGGFNAAFQIDTKAPDFQSYDAFAFGKEIRPFPARISTFFYNTGAFPTGSGDANFSYGDQAASFSAVYTGDKLYTGPESDPVLKTGTFSLGGTNIGSNYAGGTLKISAVGSGGPGAPAPEVGIGLSSALAAGIALFLTRKRKPGSSSRLAH